jgi:hypothetical protein
MIRRFFIWFIQLNLLATLALCAELDAKVLMVNFPTAEGKKVLEAVELIKKVVATSEFKDRIINHTFRGKKMFVDNNGCSNEQIYQMILDGAETITPDKNRRIDVELELYEQSGRTIGYTYPHTPRVWINNKFFKKYTPVQVADNLFHEWLHKLGFDHAQNFSQSRNYSVPYAIGYLVEELAAKFYQAGQR